MNGGAAALSRSGSFERRLSKQLFSEHRVVYGVLLGALLEALFGLAAPWLAARAIDTALPQQSNKTLGLLVALSITAGVHAAWAGWLHERLTISLQHALEARCLNELLARLLAVPAHRLDDYNFGSSTETMAMASNAALSLVHAVAGLAVDGVGLAVMGLALFVTAPGIAGLTLLCGLVMGCLAHVATLREANARRNVVAASSQQRQLLHLLLRATPQLRVGGATTAAIGAWGRLLEDQADATNRQAEAEVTRSVVLLGCPRLLSLLATGYLVQATLAGERSLGDMILVTMLVTGAMTSCVNLMRTTFAFQALRPQLGRVTRLLLETDDRPSVPSVAKNRTDPSGDGPIRLDNIWFRYAEGAPWVLRDQTLEFPVGGTTVLRAASGAGKSTVLRLLAGSLSPEHGRVQVLGRNPANTRGLVGYLPQQSALFEGSIESNLQLLSGAPATEVARVAKLTGLADWLATLPMGAQTLVSTGGGNISAGQRQLILLTAAFATECALLLLDEPASQLDAASQERIDWAKLGQRRTVVVVAHG